MTTRGRSSTEDVCKKIQRRLAWLEWFLVLRVLCKMALSQAGGRGIELLSKFAVC